VLAIPAFGSAFVVQKFKADGPPPALDKLEAVLDLSRKKPQAVENVAADLMQYVCWRKVAKVFPISRRRDLHEFEHRWNLKKRRLSGPCHQKFLPIWKSQSMDLPHLW
jgi:hypothetical protein